MPFPTISERVCDMFIKLKDSVANAGIMRTGNISISVRYNYNIITGLLWKL